MNFYRYLGARLEESANRPGIFDTARRIEGAQRLQSLTWDEVRRGRAIVGTPEMVADNLASLRDQLGLAGILAELNTGGLIRTSGSCARCSCCARRCSRVCATHKARRRTVTSSVATAQTTSDEKSVGMAPGSDWRSSDVNPVSIIDPQCQRPNSGTVLVGRPDCSRQDCHRQCDASGQQR